MSGKRKQESIGPDERAKIRRLRSTGASLEQIAATWEVAVAEVEQILTQETPPSDGASDEVARLMNDPDDLCCPLSHELMDDPVVAADGVTYERSWVEDALKRMPHRSPTTGAAISTTVLLPNHTVKSMIVCFKENTVKEILSLVPRLASQHALALLKRGEDFVRPLLPDISAKRKLADLLIPQMKLPGTDRNAIAKEAMSLLAEVQDNGKLLEALSGLVEPAFRSLLASVDEETISQLHASIPADAVICREIAKELMQRLASRLTEDRLNCLWSLIQASLHDEQLSCQQAAACLLASHMDSLKINLGDLCSEVLTRATGFVDDQDAAIAFAKLFFQYDLGISACEPWPRKSTASIFLELAHRLANDKSEERLQLLVRAHGIDDSHEAIRQTLAKQLQHQISSQDLSDGFEQQGLLLKLALKEGEDLPENVLAKLTLEERHLCQPSPRQLMLLAQQLGSHDRCSDGARVAVFAARAFESSEQGRESEDAYLQAFRLDHANHEAAQGIVKAVASAHDRCKKLEDASSLLRVVWDLSSYDFTDFQKSQQQKSEKFHLPCGVRAWMSLYPKGKDSSCEGWAGLFLNVDKPAVVKWTCQSGRSEPLTAEHDFSKAKADGTPNGHGWRDFMAISEANGSITLRILSVQLPGSTLSFY